ncbi:MAG: UDP-N-acetylglucosamine 1-carboxyvinyltransferase, partial [Clostridia bacterium]
EKRMSMKRLICCADIETAHKQGETYLIINEETIVTPLAKDLMEEMRASVLFLAPLVKLFGLCKLAKPGGCKIGSRPIDLHIKALRYLGVDVVEEDEFITAKSEKIISGDKVYLPFPSVGATENTILTAVCAVGETIIYNPAAEPEIEDLINFLNKCGAKIHICGDGSILIKGVQKLSGCVYEIIPDRIVATTFIGCVAAAGGSVCLRKADINHLSGVLPFFQKSGCEIKGFSKDIVVSRKGSIKSAGFVKTDPYPGFPTDAQAILMSNMAIAKGNTTFYETIFENRYNHVSQLRKMGANIDYFDRVAYVTGVKNLHGAVVSSPDLRGGVALVVAALCAEGETKIENIKYILRGYDSLEKSLSQCGLNIMKK